MGSAMYKCLFGDDASKKKAMSTLDKTLEPFLSGIEVIIGENTTGETFLFGKGKPHMGDLAIHDMCSSKFPGLLELKVDMKN